MGTNYYLNIPDCEYCGSSSKMIHIGKSSVGWCFALHVIPEHNINTLDDWRNLWSKSGTFISNEYGEKVSIADMELIITVRFWRGDVPRRHDYCLENGDGTWDYFAGDFS